MRKLALVGYGKMGRMLEQLAPEYGFEVTLRLDVDNNAKGEGFTEKNFEGIDAAIEFTVPEAAVGNLEKLLALGVRTVCGTTGWYDELKRIEALAAAHGTGLVYSPNFSIGVTLLLELVAEAAKKLEGYEIDLLEVHHDRKVDAPSGTALALARAAAAARGQDLQHAAVYARHGITGKRDPDAIGIQALRLGDCIGEHTVYFAGPGERIELAHRALSRDNFASGALRAARWVVGRAPGLYGMRDVLQSA